MLGGRLWPLQRSSSFSPLEVIGNEIILGRAQLRFGRAENFDLRDTLDMTDECILVFLSVHFRPRASFLATSIDGPSLAKKASTSERSKALSRSVRTLSTPEALAIPAMFVPVAVWLLGPPRLPKSCSLSKTRI